MKKIFDNFNNYPFNLKYEENKDEFFIDFLEDLKIDKTSIDNLFNSSYIFIIILF
jgi:hypothetical protein